MPIALMLLAMLLASGVPAAAEPELPASDSLEAEVSEPADPEPATELAPLPPPLSGELRNPSFETELMGWDRLLPADFSGMVTAATEVKREGESALHLLSTQPGQWPWVTQIVTGIQPGANYTLGAWCRGEADNDSPVALKLEFLTADGRWVGARMTRTLTAGEEWQEITVEARAGFGATQARVMLRLSGEGQVWFDDVTFFRDPEPAILVGDPERLALIADTETPVVLRVASGEAALSPGKATLDIMARGRVWKSLEVDFTASEAQTLRAEPRLPGLPTGDYMLRAKLTTGEVQWPLFVTPAKRQPTTLNPNGALLRNGKPFFPVGIYHVTPVDYPRLKEHGFTAAQGPAGHDPRWLTGALQEASKQGLGLVVPLYAEGKVAENLTASQQKLKATVKQPAVLGWKLLDEPVSHPEVADQLPDAYRRLRQMDKARPLLLTLSAEDDPAVWAHFCDILEVSVMPLPDQPLTEVAVRLKAAQQALQPWQGLFALLQAGWSTAPGNQPTPQQARCMAYLAVLNGAKGIFWYALRDPGWNLTETLLWSQLKAINEEATKLGTLSLTREALTVTVSDNQVQAAAWKSATGATVAVVNPGTTTVSVTLSLPNMITAVEGSSEQVSVEMKDGAISMTLSPAATAMIEVALGATPP